MLYLKSSDQNVYTNRNIESDGRRVTYESCTQSNAIDFLEFFFFYRIKATLLHYLLRRKSPWESTQRWSRSFHCPEQFRNSVTGIAFSWSGTDVLIVSSVPRGFLLSERKNKNVTRAQVGWILGLRGLGNIFSRQKPVS